MKRFSVKYIRREGFSDTVTIMAESKGDARRIAEERGYEDIIKVSHAEFPVKFVVIVVLVAAVVAALVLV